MKIYLVLLQIDSFDRTILSDSFPAFNIRGLMFQNSSSISRTGLGIIALDNFDQFCFFQSVENEVVIIHEEKRL